MPARIRASLPLPLPPYRHSQPALRTLLQQGSVKMVSIHWAQKRTISAVTVPRCLAVLQFSYCPQLRSLFAINIAVCTLHCVVDITTTRLQESALSSRGRLYNLVLLLLIKLPLPIRPMSVWSHPPSLTLSILLRLSRAMLPLCMRVLLLFQHLKPLALQRLLLRQHRVLWSVRRHWP